MKKPESEIPVGDSLVRLIRTQKGQRVMRPKYGVGLQERMDRNQDASFKLGLISEVSGAIRENEPRAGISAVNLTGEGDGMRLGIELNDGSEVVA